MRFIKNNITKVILASLIFPIVLSVMGLIVSKKVTSMWQALGDLIVFLVAYLLNQFYFKQKIHWFNQRNILKQLLTSLPAIIIVAFLDLPMIGVSDFKIRFTVIAICLLVGLAEEFVFRGILIGLFLKITKNNSLGTVIGSSVLFGLIHMTNLRRLPIGYVSSQVIFAIAVGVLFGTIYLKTSNLSIVILLHALRDMFPMFSDKTMLQASQTTFSVISIYGMIIFLAITLIIAYIQLRNFKIKEINN